MLRFQIELKSLWKVWECQKGRTEYWELGKLTGHFSFPVGVSRSSPAVGGAWHLHRQTLSTKSISRMWSKLPNWTMGQEGAGLSFGNRKCTAALKIFKLRMRSYCANELVFPGHICTEFLSSSGSKCFTIFSWTLKSA